jgi:hypothetical protein
MPPCGEQALLLNDQTMASFSELSALLDVSDHGLLSIENIRESQNLDEYIRALLRRRSELQTRPE